MKKILLCVLSAIILVAAAVFTIRISRYVIVDFQLYPRDAAVLDLRGQEIAPSHYHALSKKLPDTRIQWDIPFQGGILADDTQTIAVTSLSPEEAQLLAECLPDLRTVDGRQCTDYESLLLLKQHRPAVQVQYWVPINGTSYAASAMQISLNGITREELELLPYLPQLRTVTLSGGDPELLRQLQSYCRENDITLRLLIQGELVPDSTPALKVHGITNEEVSLLYLLDGLWALHLTEPEADGKALVQLRQALPKAAVTWEKSVLSQTFSQDVREIDLTDILSLGANQLPGTKTAYQYSMEYGIQGTPEEVPSSVKLLQHRPLPDKTAETAGLIQELEAAMEYFPEAEKLVLCGSVLDNEAMAAFRQRQADQYKVVWTVRCGKIATRTDATFFMPVKYHVYYLNDTESYNLRYCPDMIAVDIGHMMVSDISFVEFMPDLQYLILAHTAVRNIEPLRSCKNLKFLELDHTGVLDFSPLTECTALEDLNIGMTWNDVAPLKDVTWLKNLWMIERQSSAEEMMAALPNTNIVCFGTATVDSGWRELPNYFAMRDELLMFYMGW